MKVSAREPTWRPISREAPPAEVESNASLLGPFEFSSFGLDEVTSMFDI